MTTSPGAQGTFSHPRLQGCPAKRERHREPARLPRPGRADPARWAQADGTLHAMNPGWAAAAVAAHPGLPTPSS